MYIFKTDILTGLCLTTKSEIIDNPTLQISMKTETTPALHHSKPGTVFQKLNCR